MIQPTNITYEWLSDGEVEAVSVDISCSEEITIAAISYDPGNGQYLPLCQAVEYDGITVVLPISLAQGDHSLTFVGTTLDGFGIALEGTSLDQITSLVLSNEPTIQQRIPVPDELLLPISSSVLYLDNTSWFWDDASIFLDGTTFYLDDSTWFWDDENVYLDQ